MRAGEMKEKVRGILSEKGTVDADETANELVVTDYNDNLRLLSELIDEFDVSDSDWVIRIFPLKFIDVEEAGNLIGAILSAQPLQSGGSPAAARPSSSPMPGGPGMMISIPGMSSGSSAPAQPGGIGSQIVAPQARLWPDRDGKSLILVPTAK